MPNEYFWLLQVALGDQTKIRSMGLPSDPLTNINLPYIQNMEQFNNIRIIFCHHQDVKVSAIRITITKPMHYGDKIKINNFSCFMHLLNLWQIRSSGTEAWMLTLYIYLHLHVLLYGTFHGIKKCNFKITEFHSQLLVPRPNDSIHPTKRLICLLIGAKRQICHAIGVSHAPDTRHVKLKTKQGYMSVAITETSVYQVNMSYFHSVLDWTCW